MYSYENGAIIWLINLFSVCIGQYVFCALWFRVLTVGRCTCGLLWEPACSVFCIHITMHRTEIHDQRYTVGTFTIAIAVQQNLYNKDTIGTTVNNPVQ